MSRIQKKWLTPFLNRCSFPQGDCSARSQAEAAGFLWKFSHTWYRTFTRILKCVLIFPRGDQLLAPEVFSCMDFVWMSSSPVGMLSLTTSEPSSSPPCMSSFVLSNAPADCPVGFADSGPVSVDGLRSSVGIFVRMSRWSRDLTLQTVALQAGKWQLSVTEPFLFTFLRSASDHRTVVLPGCKLTADRTPESSLKALKDRNWMFMWQPPNLFV